MKATRSRYSSLTTTPTALFAFGFLLLAPLAIASILGSVRGLIHDPQHRPVRGAIVKLRAVGSAFEQTVNSNDAGEFVFDKIPIGEYTVDVQSSGFRPEEQQLALGSGRDIRLHFSLKLAAASETVNVTDEPVTVNPTSSTSATLISRAQIAQTPGADQSNSLAMITSSVPGAYVVHDQLHIRGGHQVSWLLDGVPVPNTNIASNVGPQFDPKDIDYLEVQRGGYDAEYGDRTYGVFNVVTRSGFERNRQAELVASYGSFNNTNDQINFGDHTERFAYYGSLSGNRTDLGLESPVGQILHDRENGFGGFGSLIYNANPRNQLRLVTSLRRDFYQIPNTPDQQAAGIHDAQQEAYAFVNFSWVRTFGHGMLLTVSPFYHYNSANFAGGRNDFPISTTDNRASSYAGGQATFSAHFWRNDAVAGFYGFGQHDNQLFGLTFNDRSNPNFLDREKAPGNLEALFLEEKLKIMPWLTRSGGVRQTHFSGGIVENATSPRAGVAIKIPYLN